MVFDQGVELVVRHGRVQDIILRCLRHIKTDIMSDKTVRYARAASILYGLRLFPDGGCDKLCLNNFCWQYGYLRFASVHVA